MATDVGSIQQMRQVYSDTAMTTVTATLRAAQLWNRDYESLLQQAKRVVIPDPHMTMRRSRAQASIADFRNFKGEFSELENTPLTLEMNHQFEHQWQTPLNAQRMSVIDEVATIGRMAGEMMAQELDHDILGYAVRGDANDGSPGLISGYDSLIPTRNQFRFGSDTNYIPLEGANAGITQGADADADMALTALKQINMQMMLNSHMKTGTMSLGDPIAIMMPATWRNIIQSAESLNIEVNRLPIFQGRDVTPEGYAGTVYGMNCFLVNPSYPDSANAGQAFFTVNQDGRLDGSSIGDTAATTLHDNRMMTRRHPTNRATTTASAQRNHACIIAGYTKALTYAQAEHINKLFSPHELQAQRAYKGWQFSTSFVYMRRILEPQFLYLAEIQCVPTVANTGGA